MSQGSNSLPLRQEYLVALGANLPSVIGSPSATIHEALKRTHQYRCKLLSVSRFFSTPAFPAGNGPDYVNAVAVIDGPGDPEEMLGALHAIEAKLGRTREERWGKRVLDLDLLAAGALVLPDAESHAAWRALPLAAQQEKAPDVLVLPHPRLQERAFVLVPLADVAPDWVHPLLGHSVVEMRDQLPRADLEAVVALS